MLIPQELQLSQFDGTRLNSEFVSFLKEGDWIYSCEHLCACRTLWRKGQTLRKQYKEKISDYRNRDQLEHAHDYLLYPENIGENLSLDETCLSNGDVYTILTNKAAKFSDWAISTEPLQRFAKVKKRQAIFTACRSLSEWGDSNARPLRPERSALPTALHSVSVLRVQR